MKNDSNLQRYFLAIIPPEPVYSEAQQFKNIFKVTYNSRAALNSPPHITLHMPFLWKAKKEKLLLEGLKRFGVEQAPFDIRLENFKAFPPRVIYMDVVTDPILLLFQKELHRFCKREFQLFNANRLDHAYHPHLTLAFRDLKKEMFATAWEDFKHRSCLSKWSVNSFSLLQHDGISWHEKERFVLEKTIC